MQPLITETAAFIRIMREVVHCIAERKQARKKEIEMRNSGKEKGTVITQQNQQDQIFCIYRG
jgi:hypothetical protein